jgi:hypothetical protein
MAYFIKILTIRSRIVYEQEKGAGARDPARGRHPLGLLMAIPEILKRRKIIRKSFPIFYFEFSDTRVSSGGMNDDGFLQGFEAEANTLSIFFLPFLLLHMRVHTRVVERAHVSAHERV